MELGFVFITLICLPSLGGDIEEYKMKNPNKSNFYELVRDSYQHQLS